MKSDLDYPRMLFHRQHPPATVNSEAEEKALGPEWSRTIPVEEPIEPPPGEEEPEEEKRQPVRLPAHHAAAKPARRHR